MARRKDQGSEQVVFMETVTDERPGETHVHRTVREWHPHAPERLSEIEAIIDSWGRRAGDDSPRLRQLPPDELQARVDKITRRVKGSRKVVVQETVTEWVERPVKKTRPEPDLEPETTEAAVGETVLAHQRAASASSRPKRGFLGFIGKKSPRADKPAAKKFKLVKPKEPAADASEPDYQPQCVALTEDGSQCRNSARGVSRYCSSHKGYQPPTAKGLAKRIEGDAWDPNDQVTDRESVKGADTRPVVGKAKDTRIKVRKAPKKSSKKAGRKKR